MCIISRLLICLCLFHPFAQAEDIPLPLRAEYPDVKTIEIEDLYRNMDKYIIIDVRSRYEFGTIHINGARNLPLSKKWFVDAIRRVSNSSDKPLVFYCNGITCRKSYKACMTARQNQLNNIFAFDQGVLNWTKVHPDQAVLLGETPADIDKMISNEKFKEHLLSPAEFVNKISEQTAVIDVRDKFQRENVILKEATRHITLNNPSGIFDIAKKEEKTLLIYDAVGKQVRWLQYHLENASVNNYFFMEKGVNGYLEYTKGPGK